MKFEIKNRWTGAVQFTAKIDCADDTATSIKIGLAVRWGIENGANLSGADLSGADLRGANLIGANLRGANLSGANLIGANLSGANLRSANLSGANLRSADLIGANLSGANLRGANLSGADLSDANLRGANLSGANLRSADLSDANLRGANLSGAHGANPHIKCIQIDTYAITYTSDVMQIGCERHTIAEWASFSDAQIRAMDGVKALARWQKYKDWIFQTIALCPAEPTK